MPARIDAFAHLIPEELIDETGRRYPDSALAGMGEADHFWDVDRRLADMDRFDVDRQVIMLTQHDWPAIGSDEGRELVSLGNDCIRQVADDHPDRFVPVATIPYVDDAGLAEFDRCVHDLDMRGIQIFTNDRGRPVDSDAHRALYRRAADADVPVWIHPQTHDWYDWTDEYVATKMLGWPFDTSLAMSRLVFSGIVEEFSDLDFVVHHTGGMVPHYAERIEAYYHKEDGVGWVDLDEPVLDNFRQFHADTMLSGSVSALECGRHFFGADQMLFGTDYPFGPRKGKDYVDITVDSVEGLSVSDAEREQIFAGNVRSLLS